MYTTFTHYGNHMISRKHGWPVVGLQGVLHRQNNIHGNISLFLFIYLFWHAHDYRLCRYSINIRLFFTILTSYQECSWAEPACFESGSNLFILIVRPNLNLQFGRFKFKVALDKWGMVHFRFHSWCNGSHLIWISSCKGLSSFYLWYIEFIKAINIKGSLARGSANSMLHALPKKKKKKHPKRWGSFSGRS